MGIRLLKQPAENYMYSCYDRNVGFGLPFSCANDQIALKSFEYYCITDEEGKMKAEDLTLYKVGTWNRDTGEYKNTRHKIIGKGTKYAVSNSTRGKNQNVSTCGK